MTLQNVNRFQHSSNAISRRAWCCAWKHDGRLLATSGEDKVVKVWLFNNDYREVSLLTQICGDQLRTIRSVTFSPCGRYLATASFDATVLIYEYDDGSYEEKHKLEGHENEVKCVAFSASGQYLATSSRDKTVFIWQFDEDEDVEVDAVLQSHSGDVKFVIWHPLEEILVSGGYDCSVCFYSYDGSDWVCHQQIQFAHQDSVWNARFSNCGRYLISVGGDSKAKVWKRDGAATTTKWSSISSFEFPGAQWPIYTIDYDHFSNLFVVGGGDRIVWWCSLENETITIMDSQVLSSDMNCCAFNPKDSGLLALVDDDGNGMDCDISGYHVESFNFMCDVGIQSAIQNIPPEKFKLSSGEAVEYYFTAVKLGKPSLQSALGEYEIENVNAIMPAECRQRGLTYRAPLVVTLDLKINGILLGSYQSLIGHVPIMLRSSRCHLAGLSEEELIEAGEERLERGGYFVCKGSEKVMRLLVGNKRNFPVAIIRNSFRDKGKMFTEFGVIMRCIREGYSSSLIQMHYLDSATIVLAIQYQRELFYIPLLYIMKALTDLSDVQIYKYMVLLRPGDSFWASCVKNMLTAAAEEGVKDRESALLLLGARFRVALKEKIAPWETDETAGRYLLERCVCIHLNSDSEKFHCLSLMSQKLISLALGEILPENPDNPQFQEATTSGHIFLLIIRERLENVLSIIRRKIFAVQTRRGEKFTFDGKVFTQQLRGSGASEITRGLEYFLATGNLMTSNGLGLMQAQGFSVVAERINQLRFVSHFRAIHRGAFFMETRTTDVRKLRPEAFGFICPLHTPDGAPCGLLNHVTASCDIVTHLIDDKPLLATLKELGVHTHNEMTIISEENENQAPLYYPVVVNGKFFGYVHRAKAPLMERQLRSLKIDSRRPDVPATTEIALIRYSTDPQQIICQFPGLYIYTEMGRMIRPVRNVAANKTEYIGIFEQVYLSVVIDPEEAEPGVTMHQELHPCSLFSFAGNLIPFPDHNQSPRNVYQCQMGKQTMGIPVHAWRTRADNKMYNLTTPQTPLLRLESHNKYRMDDYPLGTNACVAVISYTGYDMEDAMVINKSSFERGFAHGMVIKVERITLVEKKLFGGLQSDCIFARNPNDPQLNRTISEEGLPYPGRLYKSGDIYYCKRDRNDEKYVTGVYKSVESAFCGLVRIVQDSAEGIVHALIQWRIPRNPIIGDKFASRHGQKGINSFLWPAESLPFSESGMVPDIIFNPHGFPSRMTIGMMIESMAGKSSALNGSFYDASPFVFNEKNPAINHFGELLKEAGYNYYGNETMYSGVDGREMEVQIFFGIVYYQRLRHMIADKYQVRATGVVDAVTLQPLKGRKKGGGIRFGEMERDTMIAHGAAFCLQDRLLYSSDLDFADVCGRCCSIVSVTKLRPAAAKRIADAEKVEELLSRKHCLICGHSDDIYNVQMPRVFRYLAAELSSMGIRLRCELEDPKYRRPIAIATK